MVKSGASAPPSNTVIESVAEVSHSGGSGASASANVIVDAAPALALGMVGDRDPVTPGETLTYTLSFGNPGAVDLPAVVLRGVVPAGTTFVSANDGGVLSGNEVQWDLGTAKAGAGGQRRFSVTVNAGVGNGATHMGYAALG